MPLVREPFEKVYSKVASTHPPPSSHASTAASSPRTADSTTSSGTASLPGAVSVPPSPLEAEAAALAPAAAAPAGAPSAPAPPASADGALLRAAVTSPRYVLKASTHSV